MHGLVLNLAVPCDVLYILPYIVGASDKVRAELFLLEDDERSSISISIRQGQAARRIGQVVINSIIDDGKSICDLGGH
jgi:hypothetical protein